MGQAKPCLIKLGVFRETIKCIGGVAMNLTGTGAIYTMVIVIKALKVYIIKS